MLSFECDYNKGAHPKILEALVRTNMESCPGYGSDPYTESAKEKIRAAFDAYIFLSYRKKDRAYAQELMHLIHKNRFCKDIAIWYDEFLTPGESFRANVEKMMRDIQSVEI